MERGNDRTLKVNVTIGQNMFSIDGMTFGEVRPILDRWFELQGSATVAGIQSITRELKAENDREEQLVKDHAGT